MVNSPHSEKGRTFVFCFTHNFLHTDLVGVPMLSHMDSSCAHYFQEERNAIVCPSACLRLETNRVLCNQVLAGVAVLLVGKSDPLNSKHRQILNLDPSLL